MIRLLFSAFFVLSVSSTFADTVVCNSKDYAPATFTGQSLTLTVESSVVTAVRKNEGSWFCASSPESAPVGVNGPRILSRAPRATVYELNFGCDEFNGRLIVDSAPTPRWANYEFSWNDDNGVVRNRSALRCFPVRALRR